MKFETAIKKARSGEFEFVYDIKRGQNEIRYQTPSGKWKSKYIEITDLPVYSLSTVETGRF